VTSLLLQRRDPSLLPDSLLHPLPEAQHPLYPICCLLLCRMIPVLFDPSSPLPR
jgi:hypothetical protein